MKKIRNILAVMSAAAVMGSMNTFVSEGAVATPDISFGFEADKTEFEIAEVRNGEAVAKVSFLCNNLDNISFNSLLTNFKFNDDGVRFKNIEISEPNAFTSEDGFGMVAMDISLYDTYPDDVTQPSDTTGFYLMNGSNSPIIINDVQNSIVTFDVVFPEDIGTGIYTLDVADNFQISYSEDIQNTTDYTKYTTVEPITFTIGEPGDITGDCSVNLYDAIEISKYVMNMIEFSDATLALADYNADGDVNLYDVIDIAKTLM